MLVTSFNVLKLVSALLEYIDLSVSEGGLLYNVRGPPFLPPMASSINDPGRYINHASYDWGASTCQLNNWLRSQKRHCIWEELFSDYGLKSHPDFPRIGTDAKNLLQHSKKYIQQDQGNNATCLCTV